MYALASPRSPLPPPRSGSNHTRPERGLISFQVSILTWRKAFVRPAPKFTRFLCLIGYTGFATVLPILDVVFEQEELPLKEAFALIDEMGEPYKREYAQELAEKEKLSFLSFYRSGSFLDMCEGPHVQHSREIPSDGFRIKSMAGTYWRGDSRNVMMTRIYIWAFESRQALEARIESPWQGTRSLRD